MLSPSSVSAPSPISGSGGGAIPILCECSQPHLRVGWGCYPILCVSAPISGSGGGAIPILYVGASSPISGRVGGAAERGSDLGSCLPQDHEHATFEDILGMCPLTPLPSGLGAGVGGAHRWWGQHSHPSLPRGDREEAEYLPQGGQNLEDADFLPGRAQPFLLGSGAGVEDATSRDVHVCVCVSWGNSGWTPPACSPILLTSDSHRVAQDTCTCSRTRWPPLPKWRRKRT